MSGFVGDGGGFVGDGGGFGPALFEIGDVPAEDSPGGEVARPAIHRFSNMKIILTEPLTAHTLYIPSHKNITIAKN